MVNRPLGVHPSLGVGEVVGDLDEPPQPGELVLAADDLEPARDDHP